MWRSRWRPWLLVILVGSLLGACTRPEVDALRFGLADAPITLDPRFATDATSSRINRLLYARLVDFDAQMRPVPALATWQVLTPTHYRFTLGQAQRRFHDGSRLDADDVKATYEYVLHEKNASPHRASILKIKCINVLGEDVLDFRLSQPDPLFPSYLVIGIVPAEAVAQQRKLDRAPVGSGPFRFVDWTNDGVLRLQRDADGMRVAFITVSDEIVRVLKLLRGELDMLQGDVSSELVAYLEQQPQIRVERRAGSNFSYLGFNMEDPALSKLAVRQAIAHAVHREPIVRYLLGGETRLASALLPPGHWAGHAKLGAYEYDPQRARELLAQAGYSAEQPLHLEFKTSNNPLSIRQATIFQRQLAAVGIQVKVRSFDWATFYSDVKKGNFQLYSLRWVGIKSPDIFSYVFHSKSIPPKGVNRGRYRNPRVDRLIDQAEQSLDLAERQSLYQALQEEIFTTLPYVPLWYQDQFVAMRQGIEGYVLAADGNYDGLLEVRRGAAVVAATPQAKSFPKAPPQP